MAGLPAVRSGRTTKKQRQATSSSFETALLRHFLSRGARDRRQRGTARAHGPPVGQLKETQRPVRYGTNTKTRRLEQRTQNTSIPGDLQLAVDLASAVLAEQPPPSDIRLFVF